MAYFADLSPYYDLRDDLPARNVGWLQRGHAFETMAPSEETLDLLWSFCSISVMQTRGSHQCDLCTLPQPVHAERDGIRLALGSSEICVFSNEPAASTRRQKLGAMESGGLLFFRRSTVPFSVFMAPTLIYHYVRIHQYKPPEEFLRALQEGPRPPDQEYFEHLRKVNLEWNQTHRAAGESDSDQVYQNRG